MNTLDLPGTLWLASDIHLGAQVPRTAQAFEAFLQAAGQQADRIVLCGDLFDAWVGDDVALNHPPPWLAQAMHALRQAAVRRPLYLMQGNRDFLMGPVLAGHLGAQLLPGPVVLQTDAGRVLLAHGDEYCTDDQAYQRFRRLVRTPWIQRLFLALPLAVRRAIARRARAGSRRARSGKSLQIMDVNPHAVRQALQASGCGVLVHGHTHRPAVHALPMAGASATRIVLPDWDFDAAHPPRGGWVCIDRRGVQLVPEVPAAWLAAGVAHQPKNQ